MYTINVVLSNGEPDFDYDFDFDSDSFSKVVTSISELLFFTDSIKYITSITITKVG